MEMFSVLASTRPTAATVFGKSETGGGAGGSVGARRGCVRATEKVAHSGGQQADEGQDESFHANTSWGRSGPAGPARVRNRSGE